MKRVPVLLLLCAMVNSCTDTQYDYDIPELADKTYYEPKFADMDDNDSGVRYDRDMIPMSGDTCWFYVKYEGAKSKSVPDYIYKLYRWEIFIDGEKYGETNMCKDYNVSTADPWTEEIHDWWKQRMGRVSDSYNVLLFTIPANHTGNERNVEVRASVKENFATVDDRWGDWFTVFTRKQSGVRDEVSGLDYMELDGFKVFYGEYEVNGVVAYGLNISESMKETAGEIAQSERVFQDGTRITLDRNMTYQMLESGNVISTGRYEMGIFDIDTCEEKCYYYPHFPRSYRGYIRFVDESGQKNYFSMHISAGVKDDFEYGMPWLYQEMSVEEGDWHHTFGIRYGLSLCK